MSKKESNYFFTIAICTRNRSELLAICLDSIMEFASSCRVIVVDNNSTDDTHAVCEKYINSLNIKYVFEGNDGLSIARNTALDHLDTEYILYIDDDARILQGWAESICAGIEKWTPDVFGGPCKPYYLAEKPEWFDNSYGSSLLEYREGLLDHGYIQGFNMGWKKSVIEKAGGFPRDLGMIADNIGLGEETWLHKEARRQNPELRTAFLPASIVEHYVPEVKMTAKYWAKRRWKQGEQIRDIDDSFHRWWKVLPLTLKETVKLIWLVIMILFRDRKKHPHWKGYFVFVILPRLYFWSYLYHLIPGTTKK